MEMLVEWRWETVFTKRREGVKLGRPDVGRTRIAMERILHGAYAKSTRKMRIFIMNRYEEFLKETQMEHGEDGAMIFLTWMGSRTKASTCLTYATTLISLHPELKGQKMRQYMKGLIRMGALRPKFQANPITQQEIYKILEDMPIRLMVPTFLAWKTTSRWSDITQLRKENVHWISDEEMIIQFTDTKGAAHRPFREDHLVHLTHAESMSEIRKRMENLGSHNSSDLSGNQQLLQGQGTSIYHPQHQKRSDDGPDGRSKNQSDTIGDDTQDGKTREKKPNSTRHDDQIPGRQSGPSSEPRNRASNSTAIGHAWGYYKKATKTSTAEEMKSLPFHCKEVGTINKDALTELANDHGFLRAPGQGWRNCGGTYPTRGCAKKWNNET
eukprot:PhF_6_TR33679/c0_g1_i2/m.49336